MTKRLAAWSVSISLLALAVFGVLLVRNDSSPVLEYWGEFEIVEEEHCIDCLEVVGVVCKNENGDITWGAYMSDGSVIPGLETVLCEPGQTFELIIRGGGSGVSTRK